MVINSLILIYISYIATYSIAEIHGIYVNSKSCWWRQLVLNQIEMQYLK